MRDEYKNAGFCEICGEPFESNTTGAKRCEKCEVFLILDEAERRWYERDFDDLDDRDWFAGG